MDGKMIKKIATKKGEFVVSWRYREDYIRSLCRGLLKEKFFKKVVRSKGVDIFITN